MYAGVRGWYGALWQMKLMAEGNYDQGSRTVVVDSVLQHYQGDHALIDMIIDVQEEMQRHARMLQRMPLCAAATCSRINIFARLLNVVTDVAPQNTACHVAAMARWLPDRQQAE